MRCLLRNKSKMYYSSYLDKTQITDDYGNSTGEYEKAYSEPVEFYAYVTPATGSSDTRRFGELISYDKIIVLDNESPTIDEYSILWVDTMPQIGLDGEFLTNDDGDILTPHDYIVKKVAKSLNSTLIAISKVNVSA